MHPTYQIGKHSSEGHLKAEEGFEKKKVLKVTG
jgi:hypothetical protein